MIPVSHQGRSSYFMSFTTLGLDLFKDSSAFDCNFFKVSAIKVFSGSSSPLLVTRFGLDLFTEDSSSTVFNFFRVSGASVFRRSSSPPMHLLFDSFDSLGLESVFWAITASFSRFFLSPLGETILWAVLIDSHDLLSHAKEGNVGEDPNLAKLSPRDRCVFPLEEEDELAHPWTQVCQSGSAFWISSSILVCTGSSVIFFMRGCVRLAAMIALCAMRLDSKKGR